MLKINVINEHQMLAKLCQTRRMMRMILRLRNIRNIRNIGMMLGLLCSVTACIPSATQQVYQLNLRPDPSRQVLSADTFLTEQRIPPELLTDIPTAMQRAPVGSLILACWQEVEAWWGWGPCTHIARKIDDSHLTDMIGLFERAGLYPLSRFDERYAVVVLDAFLTPSQLQRIQNKAAEMQGTPYDLSGLAGTYYCTTYQIALQQAAGLVNPFPFNTAWNMYLPADILLNPDSRILWVGLRNFGAVAPQTATAPHPK